MDLIAKLPALAAMIYRWAGEWAGGRTAGSSSVLRTPVMCTPFDHAPPCHGLVLSAPAGCQCGGWHLSAERPDILRRWLLLPQAHLP